LGAYCGITLETLSIKKIGRELETVLGENLFRFETVFTWYGNSIHSLTGSPPLDAIKMQYLLDIIKYEAHCGIGLRLFQGVKDEKMDSGTFVVW